MSHTATEIFWSTIKHPIFQNKPLYVAATNEGLCRITWPQETFETLQSWAARHVPNALLIEDEAHMREYIGQLRQYFDGAREAFSLPLDMRGTPFQTAVWRALAAIPFGQTRSYSDIAKAVANPAATRAVGTANGANPVPIVVPCHRVIGKNNALTGFRGGLQAKEELLRLEGVHAYIASGHARFQF